MNCGSRLQTTSTKCIDNCFYTEYHRFLIPYPHQTNHGVNLGGKVNTSAICIKRAQFEALTRAIWLFYAASDEKVENTFSTLSELSQNADQKPNNAEMIKAVDGKAPAQAVLMLKEFRDVQWTALNSFVHGGIHALQRHGSGYPIQLVEQIIKSSNGLLTMTAMMSAILTGNDMITKDIARIQHRHKACLPQY